MFSVVVILVQSLWYLLVCYIVLGVLILVSLLLCVVALWQLAPPFRLPPFFRTVREP